MFDTTAHSSLTKLQNLLKFEKHIWILGAGVIFVPPGLILGGVLTLAVIFTPYMLWHLRRAGWNKAIAVFFAIVVAPYVAIQFIQTESVMAGYLLGTIPLIAFFSYTWILSLQIGSYLNEMETIRMWEAKSRLRK